MRSPFEPIEEKDADHPEAREQWFLRGRTIPGQNTAALRYRAHQQKMQLRALRLADAQKKGFSASQALAPATAWVPLGPAPLASDATAGLQDYNWVSGRSTAVAIDPNDLTGNTVYVGGAYGGVWKSTNATTVPTGVTWTPVIDDQGTLAVGSIAVQPGNGNVVLVGTGETNSSADSYYGLGILRSTDGGGTWTLIKQDNTGTHPFAGMGFSKIAFSTTTPSLVVAAAASAAQGVNTNLDPTGANRGIYYSTDSGATWNFASIKDGATTIAPGSVSNVVYNAMANKFFASIRFHGIYSSSDGISWTRLTTQPGTGLTTLACPANPSSSSCPIYRGEFAVVPARNEMYLWFMSFNNATGAEIDQGIWKSTNGGGTWTKLTSTGITNCGDSFGCGITQGSYNLELAAVPNGSTSTDLYAGSINLYKCTITTSSGLCGGSGSNTFVNLTHVYGCSAIAKVHPDQHDVDFIVASGKALIYFSNDGGIYRALDGYTGLTTGTCGGTNLFDSLNQTLGSMTQFVSFSQHPTDLNTILGGTQDNGSPATASSQSTSTWLNVNAGDGGFNEINPNSPTQWFTTNTDVSIQLCNSGINCLAQTFPVVIGNAEVGGDHGEFYTPYILDPQNSSQIIVGTCRVWRGNSDGTGSGWAPTGTALSPNFEVGGTSTCTGGEVNLIRFVAAGGPTDTNGFSKVIYAGTDGFGPGVASGGHIWVSTNAAGGTSTWFDRTGSINPSHFPISGVALDASDATGNTAYITIMGFHVSHVFKTTNAGQTWTDFSGTLPDSPANAIVVDPSSPGTVYVGTDVGVFSSSTASANWTEVGPAPSSGLAGYLPNVSVTALRIFNSAGTKRLRASTYGRGIWEFSLAVVPDYTLTITNPSLSILPGGSAVFNGKLTSLNGYASSVALSCNGTTPPTCTVNPTSLVPTVAGASFTVTASSNAIQTYSFNVKGVGTDGATTTHTSPVTLTVNQDFTINNSTSAQTVLAGQTAMYNLNLAPVGSGTFVNNVTYSCSGLPTGAGCAFLPAQINAGSGATAVALSVSTAGPNNAHLRPTGRNRQIFLSMGISAVGLVLIGFKRRRRRHHRYAQLGAGLMIVLLGALIACGGGGSSSPPPNPITVSITPTSASVFPGQTQQFMAAVSGTSNTAVTWSVPGGAANGTIDATGLYTAPAAVPNPSTVTVSAVSQANSAKSDTSSVMIDTPTGPGTYTITVNATSGTLTHSTTVTLTVQ